MAMAMAMGRRKADSENGTPAQAAPGSDPSERASMSQGCAFGKQLCAVG
jgi:hypothetical protein